MVKVLVVLDNKRDNYYNDKGQFDYFNQPVGKKLIKLIHQPSALGVSVKDTMMAFAYPAMPELNKAGKPKRIPKGHIMKYKPLLDKVVLKCHPKVIIGMGTVANQALFPKGGISSNRGMPKIIKYTFKGQSIKVPTIVTFNLETASIKPYMYSFIKSDFHTASKMISNKHFHIGVDLSQYKYITDFNKVKEIFHNLKDLKKYPIVAVDTETNSLKPWCEGSKIIVFSLAWRENQGVCIPLRHKQTPFGEAQIEQIEHWLRQLMMSKRYKVLHNGKYDIKFMMLQMGLPYARDCVDTLLMHYVGISEEQGISRGLKQLTMQYTSMGDYSSPLKKYKKKIADQHLANFMDKYNRLKGTPDQIYKKDYKPLQNPVDGGDFNYEWIPLRILAPYAAADTDATFRLFQVFKHYINKEPKWIDLIFNSYPKLENSLSRMEADGMHIDMKQVNRLKPAYKKGIDQALKVIRHTPVIKEFEQIRLEHLRQYDVERAKPRDEQNRKLIDKYKKLKGSRRDPLGKVKFNPNSTAHVKEVLFGIKHYQLPFDKDYMTQTAIENRISKSDWGNMKWYSGGKQTLHYLVKTYNSEFCKALLKYKKLYKLYDDFICKLPKMRDKHDCIHPKFIMSGTVTHRLASRDPNAQQIPAGTTDPHEFDFHYPVKSMFTSRFKGGTITNYDFKSFEVFVVTALCGEPNLVTALCNGYDAHKTNASRAFNVPYDKVTPDLRKKAKKVTFGCLYGISIPGLADQLHTDKKSAQKLYNRVLGALPVLHQYMDNVHAFVKRYNYVQTVDGFRRRLKGVSSNEYSAQTRAMRESLNAIVQGSTTAFISTAIEMIQKVFRKLHMRTKLICTVHDSIVSDSPANETRLATHIAIHIMQNLPMKCLNKFKIKDYKDIPKKLWHKDGTFHFPFISNAATGNSYGQLVPFDYNHLGKIKVSSYHLYFRLAYLKICVDNYLTYGMTTKDKHDLLINKLNQIIDEYCVK